jgi:PAS domain S-box-containing protein
VLRAGDEKRTMNEKTGRKTILFEELKLVRAPQHLCLIYDNQLEWQDFITSFLRLGLEQNEKCLYVYDTHSAKQLRDTLRSTGIEISAVEASGQLVLVHGSRFQIKEGFFNPDKTLELLANETQNALQKGFTALRITTETEWVLQQFPGSDRLFEFEAKTNQEPQKKIPCLYVCQFERGKFTTEMIKGIMQTHPLVIRGGQVYPNTYFVAPEKFLKESHKEIQTLDWFQYAEREVRMEKELQESSQRLQLLFDNAMAVILVADETGHYIDANGAALEFMECTREELAKMTIWDTMPEGYKQTRKVPPPMLFSPQSIEAEYIINGKAKTLLLNMVPVTAGGKSIVYGIGQDITHRKEMEKSLRDSQERWQFALEGSGDGVWDWDLISNRVYFSKQWKFMLGYDDSEIGDNLQEWESRIHPEDRDRVFAEWTKHFEGKTRIYICEHRVRCKNGFYKWILNRGKIISRSAEGRPLRAIGTHTDISLPKQMGDALFQSEQNFRAMAENNNDAIFVLAGERADVVYCNKQTSDLIGYSHDDLLSLTLQDLVAPHERSRLLDNYFRRMRGENLSNRYEVDIIDRQGNPKVVEVTGAKTIWHDKEADLVIFRDVTERKQVEQALKTSEEKLRTIIKTIADGITITDLNGVITDLNDKALQLYQTSDKQDVAGKNILDFITPLMQNKARESFFRCIEVGILENVELVLVRSNGEEYTAALSGSILIDNRGKPTSVVIVSRDISGRIQSRKAMEDLYQKEKAQRLELEQEARSKGLFIDVLAHELRTPLTPILVSAEMLEELYASKSDKIQYKLISSLNKGVLTLSKRLEELLDIGRYIRGTFKLTLVPVDTGKFINEVLSRCKGMIEDHGRTLVTDLETDLPQAVLDQARIEQVIANLLSNAGKFSPEGGKIIFKTRLKDNGLVVEVIDFGIRITPEEMDRLFQPYHRIEQDRQKFPGIGLGLAVSKQIIEAHGGWIKVTSEEGSGNIFSFFIPLLQPHYRPSMNGA